MGYADEVLADSPVGFWLLDETSGTTAVDSSGNANHGTYNGSPALAATTVAGLTAPDFDGSNDYVLIPPISTSGGPFTIEVVARADVIVEQAEVFSEIYDPDRIQATIGLHVAGQGAGNQITAGTYGFYNWTIIQGGTWTAGDFHHLAFTYGADDTARLYVDGVAVGSTSYPPTDSNSGWRLGCKYDGGTFWNGAIAGAAMYLSEMSPERVAAHYDALFDVGPEQGAVSFTATATLSVTAEPDPIVAAVAFTATASLSVTAEPDPTLAAVSFTATATLSVTAPGTVEVVPAVAAVAFTATATLDVVVRPVGVRRRLVVVDIWGTPYGELDNATVGAISYTLNEPETFSFVLPLTDPKAPLVLAERFREVQVWRGDQLLAWGPMVRPAADKNTLAVSCVGAAWYLGRRTVGKASRTNMVTNGDFENGTTDWRVGALDPFEPLATRDGAYWSATTPTDRVLTGTHALRLEQPDSGTPKYGVSATQFLIWTVDPADVEGDQWSLVGRYYIPSADWRGPPPSGIGLQLDRYSTVNTVETQPEGGGPVEVLPAPIESVSAAIDENTPRDVWLPLEATLRSPVTGDPEFVSVTLGCPDGVIYWDRVALSLDEGERHYGEDQADIAASLIAHLQDEAYDKSPLNLATDMPATGVLRDRTWLHHEHPVGADCLAEFTTLDDGFDWSVAYTATTRTIRSHHPARGVHRPEFTIELGRNTADLGWTADGENAASTVIVLGTGDGSAREETSASDTSTYSGGLTLETVYSAPTGTPIDSLDNVAIEQLAITIDPDLLSVTLTSPQPGQPDPVGVLECGDTVPVRLHAGALHVEATYRVVALTITEAGTLDLTLNRRDET
jgi:hypothetical protein